MINHTKQAAGGAHDDPGEALCHPRLALILEPAGNLWGSEKALLDYIEELNGAGWNVAVCCPPSTPLIPELSGRGIAVYPVFRANLHLASRLTRIATVARLALLVRQCRPAVVHVNQAGATRMALFATCLTTIPVIPHVRLAEDAAYLEKLAPSLKRMPSVICISDYIRSLFRTLRPRCIVMYDSYAPLRDGSDVQRNAREMSLLCVGRVAPIKGQDILIRAAAELRAAGLDCHVRIVGGLAGTNSFARSIDRLARELGVADLLHWHGVVADPQRYLRRAIVAICSSHTEPLGRTVFEAWDAGAVPVVYAGSGGAAEVIRASGGGVLYESQDGESVAYAIRTIEAMAPAARDEMIERGREWLRLNTERRNYAQCIADLWTRAAMTRETSAVNARVLTSDGLSTPADESENIGDHAKGQ
jgi:glycosyltransferase involved in cell wall biosynthesis